LLTLGVEVAMTRTTDLLVSGYIVAMTLLSAIVIALAAS
jgi:hypothetical protein